MRYTLVSDERLIIDHIAAAGLVFYFAAVFKAFVGRSISEPVLRRFPGRARRSHSSGMISPEIDMLKCIHCTYNALTL
jgi:hypothetical protein